MPDFTVTEVKGPPREWNGDNGTILYYKLALDGIDEIAEIGQKPTTKAPMVGDIIEGTLSEVDPQWGTRKLKKTMGGGGGGRGMSPEERKRVERMACHKTAAQLLLVASQCGLLGEAKSSKDLFSYQKALTNWLVEDLP